MTILAGALWGALATASAAGPEDKQIAAAILLASSLYVDVVPWAAAGSGLGPGRRGEWAWHLVPVYGSARGLSYLTGPQCPPGSCRPQGLLAFMDGLALGSQFVAAGLFAWGAVGVREEKLGGPLVPRTPRPGGELMGTGAVLLTSATLADAAWWGSMALQGHGGQGWAWHLLPVVGPVAGMGQAASGEGGLRQGAQLVLGGVVLGGQIAGATMITAGAVRRRGEAHGGSALLLPTVLGEGPGLSLSGTW